MRAHLRFSTMSASSGLGPESASATGGGAGAEVARRCGEHG